MLVEEAHRHAVDGVICGHIHHAVIHDDFGVRYINCGDWVESCTAVVEHPDGRFEVLRWTDAARGQAAATVDLPPADDDVEICRLARFQRSRVTGDREQACQS